MQNLKENNTYCLFSDVNTYFKTFTKKYRQHIKEQALYKHVSSVHPAFSRVMLNLNYTSVRFLESFSAMRQELLIIFHQTICPV